MTTADPVSRLANILHTADPNGTGHLELARELSQWLDERLTNVRADTMQMVLNSLAEMGDDHG